MTEEESVFLVIITEKLTILHGQAKNPFYGQHIGLGREEKNTKLDGKGIRWRSGEYYQNLYEILKELNKIFF